MSTTIAHSPADPGATRDLDATRAVRLALIDLQRDGKANAVHDLVDSQRDRLYEAMAVLRTAIDALDESDDDAVAAATTTLRVARGMFDDALDRLDCLYVSAALAKDAPDLRGLCEVAT